jgi:riboflavin kinase/FMN adenylyltransferase
MKHFSSLDNLPLEASWATIGSFDGVHLGHQFIIKKLVEGAHAANKSAVVVTFFPHPVVFLKRIKAPFYLTLPDERENVLKDLGIDLLITLDFNKALSSLTPNSFMTLMNKHIRLERLLVGHDFVLGKDREGNVKRLEEIGDELGYTVDVIKPVTKVNKRISSSKIRDLIRLGKVHEVSRLLGRWYSVDCTLLPKAKTKTGNLNQHFQLDHNPEKLLPCTGVYATLLHLDKQPFLSLTKISSEDHIKDHNTRISIDTFLLDFDNTQTDAVSIKLDILKFIRQITPFESFDMHNSQMKSDLNLAREVFSHAT